ncbi:MAG: pyridoxal-phosphate dependent enzyme [Epsilonproteobacteria bacterium]|nr:pyridoxal-phosphate dependent enzyme [Campylobacterota bacterium]
MLIFNLPTPIEEHNFKGLKFLLKRDDLISPHFSGNKARKISYYINNLPSNIKTIVSYGSIQSNAMYSLAVFAKAKGINFRYYAHHIPPSLKEKSDGNYQLTLLKGAKIIEGYENLQIDKDEILINEGIATKEAFIGIKELAKEIIEQTNNKSFQIFLPSGTGTTALFLSKALKELNNKSQVYTTACVGDSNYLKEQFLKLESNPNIFPIILESKKRYRFGRLYKEFYKIWLELQQHIGVEFDLLYDPKGWITLLEHKELFPNLLYIHQGGLLGNMTMLKRYKKRFGEEI